MNTHYMCYLRGIVQKLCDSLWVLNSALKATKGELKDANKFDYALGKVIYDNATVSGEFDKPGDDSQFHRLASLCLEIETFCEAFQDEYMEINLMSTNITKGSGDETYTYEQRCYYDEYNRRKKQLYSMMTRVLTHLHKEADETLRSLQ